MTRFRSLCLVSLLAISPLTASAQTPVDSVTADSSRLRVGTMELTLPAGFRVGPRVAVAPNVWSQAARRGSLTLVAMVHDPEPTAQDGQTPALARIGVVSAAFGRMGDRATLRPLAIRDTPTHLVRAGIIRAAIQGEAARPAVTRTYMARSGPLAWTSVILSDSTIANPAADPVIAGILESLRSATP